MLRCTGRTLQAGNRVCHRSSNTAGERSRQALPPQLNVAFQFSIYSIYTTACCVLLRANFQSCSAIHISGNMLHFNRDFQFTQFTPLPTPDFSWRNFFLTLCFKIYSPMAQFMSRYVVFQQRNLFLTVPWLHFAESKFSILVCKSC